MGAQKSPMLTLLKIRNLALVDELSWELGHGLISVTGETGAGKSVIVGALKLVLGERADKSLIRTGVESCVVEAVFSLHAPEEIRKKGRIPTNGSVFFTIFQTFLSGPGETPERPR